VVERRADPPCASAQQIAASAADLARTAEDLEHAVRRFKVAG
jgi:methyl-accepting chemotaxis protein